MLAPRFSQGRLYLAAFEETTTNALLDGLPEEILGGGIEGAIEDGAKRGRERDGPKPCRALLGQVREVEDDALGRSEATLRPGEGEDHVPLGGQGVGELVEHQGRLVAEDACLLRPKPHGDQVLVLTGREMSEPVDPAPDPFKPVLEHVVSEELS